MIKIENIESWNNLTKDFYVQDLEIESKEDLKIDGTGLIGLPVGIDIHVHFRQPGYEHKEDFVSGSIAALNGGVVKVLDMPNTDPITDSVKNIIIKKELAKKSQIDILVASAITNSNIDQLREIDEVCDAYKVFMSESFGNLSINKENIEKALSILEDIESDKPVIFHAEDPDILNENKNKKNHLKQRPPEAEGEAVRQISIWSSIYPRLKFHVTHLSSYLALRVLRVTKRNNLTVDTCPRYIFFDEKSEIEEWKKKVNPPLRSEGDRIEIKDAFSTGEIEMISSDHSPHTVEEKKEKKLSGMPGVQELLPSVFSLVKRGEITWDRGIEAYHSFPSKLLNINNASIEDGNIIIADLKEAIFIDKDWVKSKVKWSAFENLPLYANIKYVIKDGKIMLKR
ncbi:MAG: dihydroorotase family protein [Candidatus Heimdallarchaeum endolithica]|uniref:Dihydroorotase family protein n=1 Tax=Candidatus Heimdallarchaeum endolithica TaxID=2876572 RepID=A0A9Y1BR61_9ARCH|nr:MAG: dihydroorotase family protein [Candidatus Heimdallarchaeum endolithica]